MPSLTQSELFDVIADDTETGFRLERLEVYNWGTFNQHVWQIAPQRHNALLTGDIGSGKSTLVDALTTLLVPHQRIVYNKAAGAESKERSLYSYIRGEYKSEKDDFTQAAKAIALRDENNYTVLLSYFYNTGFSQGITLAQVFWLKDNKRNPERFFVVAQKTLSIAQHFTGFASDILTLKKQLKKDEKIELFDNFKDYNTRFRQFFGIHHEQALELFYQTVSMKSVGNLTEFVRHHMLEKCDIDQRISELRNNFDNLNRAHEAVLKAKRQIAILQPMAADTLQHEQLSVTIYALCQCRDALPTYFAKQQAVLLKERIEQLELELEKDKKKIAIDKQEVQQLQLQEADIRHHIDDNGGRRLQLIEQEILRLTAECERKQKLANHYHLLLKPLNLLPVTQEELFYQHRQIVQSLLEKTEKSAQVLQLQQVDLRIEIKALQDKEKELKDELSSLKKRQSNIPAQMLALRQTMASVLQVEEKVLPYIGELLQVAEQAKQWEGAIERLLHQFGLSLLVPEEWYTPVNHYVERTRLQGRLIYYRAKLEKNSPTLTSIIADSLLNKIQVKADSIFYAWLQQEVNIRFNYVCCEDMDEFRRLPQAITPKGLIKSKGQRHEKDDRHRLDDRSRYILGWSNQQKITTLTVALKEVEQTGQRLVNQLADVGKQQEQVRMERDVCRDLLSITHFVDIHWQPLAQQIQLLAEEKTQIEKSSNMLQTLKIQLEKIQQAIRKKLEELTQLERKLGSKEQQLQDRCGELTQAEELALSSVIDIALQAQLISFQQTVLQAAQLTTLTLTHIHKCQQETRVLVQKKLDKQEKQAVQLTTQITRQMQTYKHQFPLETAEVDVGLEAALEYRQMLDGLQSDDLPRYEERFKQLLNEGTINSIALFQNQLTQEKQNIENRIKAINNSLCNIEYNIGTYITLLIDPVQDVDIRDFQQNLRYCLQNTLNEQNFYDEEKFLQVKTLIERFNGREGMADLDRRWTQKVCDVRNWFNFSASERWLEDHNEKEFYSDSSGKSGGQKEKLAYTILASALAYQFGLQWGVTHSRSFRFVVIDEAFGKGSNESTRYALELFKKLNLQLLIVTPLQKIHVIEDYVRSIHFIANPNGCDSVIRNLSIEEYHQEKQAYS
ncbi:MAG TPA: ATP-binding protein, partial [Gammaproteobacteria bacterium]|nr:ATP-binding protein [Gammaproteobacteria bacterium]